MRQLIQDIIMIPMHALEGAATRWRSAASLYHILSFSYHYTRKYLYFGEDYFTKYVQPGGRMLDIGCGTGFITALLENRFDHSTGLDLDINMLKKAAGATKQSDFIRADMNKLPFRQNSFDTIVSLGAIHCSNYGLLSAEMFRVLKPGGQVHLIIENKVIPVFIRQSSWENLNSALISGGFSSIDSFKIGRLYLYARACKSSGCMQDKNS